MTNPPVLLDALIAAAAEAGAVVMRHRAAGVAPERKADLSPVTVADREAEAVILRHLAAIAPGVPVVAEEEAAAGHAPGVAKRFFLVDPLDGTKEYIRGGDDFTVNIALIEDGEPVLGVVHAPARGRIYWADASRRLARQASLTDGGALGDPAPLGCGKAPGRPRAVASKSHRTPETDAYLDHCGAGERLSVGSSLKFLLVATGEADLYPRAGPTMEWDTAAGDAILRAAGGMTFDLDGQPLAYGKPGYRNPGFVATGGAPAPALRPFYTDTTAA